MPDAATIVVRETETTTDREESLKVALNRPVPLSDVLAVEAKKVAIAMQSTQIGPPEEEPTTNSR